MKKDVRIFSSFHFWIGLMLFAITGRTATPTASETKPFRIKSYAIHVNVPDTVNRFEITVVLELFHQYGDPDTLHLQLCEGFKGIIATGVSVFDDQSTPVNFIREDYIIQIPFRGKTSRKPSMISLTYLLQKDQNYKGDPHEKFSCEISDSIFHINAAATRTDNWFPFICGTYGERLPAFTLEFDIPSRFSLVASGKLISENVQGNRRILKWKNYHGITDRSLFFFAAAKTKKIIKDYPGLKITFYVPEQSPDSLIIQTGYLVWKTYRYFSDSYGRVPGREFKLFAFRYDYTSGLNFAGIPLIFFQQRVTPDEGGYPHRLVIHEISHTWWGNVVSFNSENDYWLFEGFARFSELQGLDEILHLNITKEMYRRTRLTCLPYLDYTPPISLSGKEKDRQLQVVSSYYQGATLLNYIKYIMGNTSFSKALHSFTRVYSGRLASPRDLIMIMQRNTSEQIDHVFDDYLNNSGYGEYSIETGSPVVKNNCFYHPVKIANRGNKVIYSPVIVKTKTDSVIHQIRLTKSSDTTILVVTANINDNIKVCLDPDELFPFRLYGKRGAGGIVFPRPDGKVLCYQIVRDTPLGKAGILEGSELLSIDKVPLSGKSYRDIVDLMMRPSGSVITLEIRDPSGHIFLKNLNY